MEQLYLAGDVERKICRSPRLGTPGEFADLSAIPLITEVEDRPTPWLVDGLIPEASIILLTAPPGGFKTWLALALSGAVSEGTKFLGRQTAHATVIYLDAENPQSVIRERRDILQLDGDALRIWGHWLKDSPPAIGDPRLFEIAERFHPLIVFDPFVRFHSADENSAKQMAIVFWHLRRLADAGATILLPHHLAKSQGSQYRGSTDILAGVDAAFELCKEKSKDETVLSLRCFKHRAVQEMMVKMRFNLAKGRFEVLDDPSNADSSADIERIIEVIKRKPRIIQQELMDKAGLPETNGRKLLQKYDGTLWFSSRGEGKTLRYSLKPFRAS